MEPSINSNINTDSLKLNLEKCYTENIDTRES